MTAKPGTMVDQVARAICTAMGADPDSTTDRYLPGSYATDGGRPHWQGYTDHARAAIEAMRKPNNRMLKAACAAMSPGKRPTKARVSEKAKHGIRYRAMIDAALAEDK